MLNEQSTRAYDYDPVESPDTFTHDEVPQEIASLREAIDQVMLVTHVNHPEQPMIVVQYVGQLTMSGAEAFDHMEPILKGLGMHAYFTLNEETGNHHITVLQGTFDPKPRPIWPNALLFILTLLSVLVTGATIQAGVDDRDINELSDIRIWEGWRYAFSLMLILGAHELGHYFAARRHNVSVTLPYFIPLPFIGLFGTLGAFIQLREPMRNRKVLFDVGVAGPLAGIIFAIPILFLGLATSEIEVTPTDEDILREGNSILYATAKVAVFGRILPDDDEDVFVNQFAMAGWTGLFITALNLIPLGQLDGGHVLYTLLGPRASRLFWPIIGTFAILSIMNRAWLLWTILLFFLGQVYARPLEDITPLDRRRRWIGYLAILIFILTFTPNPIEIIEATT